MHPVRNYSSLLALLLLTACVCTAIAQDPLQPSSTSLPQFTNVPVSREHGLALYQHWYQHSHSTLIACAANKKLGEIRARADAPGLPPSIQQARKLYAATVEKEFGRCTKAADGVPRQAQCLTRLVKEQFVAATNGGEHIMDRTLTDKSIFSSGPLAAPTSLNNAIVRPPTAATNSTDQPVRTNRPGTKHSSRLARYRQSTTAPPPLPASTTVATVKTSDADEGTWVGKFRLQSPSMHKRTRRAFTVRQAAGYELRSKYEGVSPLGGVGKLLTGLALLTKNKTGDEKRQ